MDPVMRKGVHVEDQFVRSLSVFNINMAGTQVRYTRKSRKKLVMLGEKFNPTMSIQNCLLSQK